MSQSQSRERRPAAGQFFKYGRSRRAFLRVAGRFACTRCASLLAVHISLNKFSHFCLLDGGGVSRNTRFGRLVRVEAREASDVVLLRRDGADLRRRFVAVDRRSRCRAVHAAGRAFHLLEPVVARRATDVVLVRRGGADNRRNFLVVDRSWCHAVSSVPEE